MSLPTHKLAFTSDVACIARTRRQPFRSTFHRPPRRPGMRSMTGPVPVPALFSLASAVTLHSLACARGSAGSGDYHEEGASASPRRGPAASSTAELSAPSTAGLAAPSAVEPATPSAAAPTASDVTLSSLPTPAAPSTSDVASPTVQECNYAEADGVARKAWIARRRAAPRTAIASLHPAAGARTTATRSRLQYRRLKSGRRRAVAPLPIPTCAPSSARCEHGRCVARHGPLDAVTPAGP